MKELKEFQKIGVQFLSSRYHAMLADDMGLGKTLQTVRALDEVQPTSALIICPANLRFTWFYALQLDCDCFLKPIILKGNAREKKTNALECWICSYEFVVGNLYYFQGHNFDVLICDEAHYLRKLTSKRTAAILGRWGVANRCGYKWMLTGTPIHNRPIDLFPVLVTLATKFLKPFITFDSFARRYCGGPYALGGSRHAELASKLSEFMLRRTKQEVLPELPPCNIEITWIEPSPGDVKLKHVLHEGSKIEIQFNEFGQLDVKTFGDQAKHRQELAIAKLLYVVSEIERVLEYKEKIVVFVHHLSVLEAFRAHFSGKMDFCVYYGKMTPLEKERAKEKFIKRKEARIFFGQIIAAGTGLDGLQLVCDTVLFAEWDWTPGGNSQATDRLYRMGQANPVNAYFLAVRGSLEERMLNSNGKKSIDQKLILGSR